MVSKSDLQKKKALLSGLFLLMFLVVPVLADTAPGYPTFKYDESRSGYTDLAGPLSNEIQWTYDFSSTPDCPPTVLNDCVYISTSSTMGSGEAGLYCIGLNNGTFLWRNSLDDSQGSAGAATVYDGNLYLGGINGYLYCIDAATGETVWKKQAYAGSSGYGLSASPLVSGGVVYVNNGDGELRAFSPADGTPLWTFDAEGSFSAWGKGYAASPATDGARIFYTGSENRLVAVDQATHAEAWNFTVAGSLRTTPVADSGTVYFTTTTNAYALSAADGSVVWNKTYEGASEVLVGSPVKSGDRIYFGTVNSLMCLDSSNGEKAWSFPCAKVDVTPVVAGDLVYFGTNQKLGVVYAVDKNSGNMEWSCTMPSTGSSSYSAFFLSSPAVAGGKLLIGVEELNRLYAFGTVPAPEAGFTADVTSGKAPLTVSFTDTSTGAESWAWDFENDGVVDLTEQNPSHTYTDTGIYSVNLTVGNDGGSDSVIRTGYIRVNGEGGPGPVWVANSDWDIPEQPSYCNPAMADLDGDGDYDLLIGVKSGISQAYENTGTSSSPVWTANSDWNAPSIGSNKRAAPSFADLDGDGDYDLIIGDRSGYQYAFENTGTSSAPAWTANTGWNPPHVTRGIGPATGDLDGDGDYDLLIGMGSDANAVGYENTGDSNSPVWAAKSEWNTPSVNSNARPDLVDLDNDGDLDLLLGDRYGGIYGYENTGDSTSPVWTVKEEWNSPAQGGYSSPSTADLDGDGDPDLMLGISESMIKGYENIPIPPVANFTSDVTTGYEPLTVSFTDSSASNPVLWFWDFDDDGTVDSTEQNTEYTYTEPGTYQANLTVKNGAGSSAHLVEIQVVQRPLVADFSSDVGSGEVPLTVTFSDTSVYASTSTPADSWSWDLDGDGNVDSTEQNPVYTYTTSGRYNVTLTVGNSDTTVSKTVNGFINAEGERNLADSSWPKFQGDSYNTGLSQNPGPQTATLYWTYAAGDSIDGGSATDSEGTVYFGSDDKKLYALYPNGSLKWSYSAAKEIKTTPLVDSNGIIYFGDNSGLVSALYPNGSLKWSYAAGDDIASSPAIGPDKTIYIGSTDGKLYALNPDGSLKWSYTTGSYIVSSPAVDIDGTIYVGSRDRKLYALTPDGSLKWSYTASNYPYGSPLIGSDATVYFGTYDSKIHALNPDGSLKWSTGSLGYISTGGLAAGPDGTLYTGVTVSTTGEGIFALNPDDGSVKWGYPTSQMFGCAPIVDSDGTIYIGSMGGVMHALNPDGTLKWSYETSDQFTVNYAMSSDGTLYAPSNSGKLYAFGDVSPVPDFSASPVYGDTPLTVEFTDKSAGSPTSWSWDFNNDGIIDSTEQNPSYIYNSDGIYSVNLTASNANGVGSTVKADYITVGSSGGDELPVAGFNMTPSTGEAPLTVQFNDTSLNSPRSWHWDFGDGETINTSNPSHTYSSIGSYDVTLTVTNIAGNDSVTKTVEVLENPELRPDAAFTYSTSGLVTPAYVKFTDTSTNSPVSWLWDFGDNTTSTLENPGHKYSRAGNYSVTLTTSNRYGSDTVVQSDIVNVEEWVVPEGTSDSSWAQFHGDVLHTGFAEGSAPDTNNVLWVSDSIGAVSASSVVVADGRVFVNCNPDIVSLDQKTGQYLSVHGEGNTKYGSWSSPAYDDGNVWCGVNPYPADSQYYTVNGGTLVADGKVFTSNWDGGQYFAFDEYTNEELWNFTIDYQNDAVAAGSRAQGCPTYKDDRLYVTSWTYSDTDKHGFIYCLNADTGELIWKQNIEPSTCASVMIHDDTIYLSTYGFSSTSASGMVALDITDGEVKWYNSNLTSSDSTPAFAYGNIYVSGGCSGYSQLITCCFNATTGEMIWKTNPDDNIGSWTCSPAVADGKVYIGPSGVNCLDAYTGELIWHGSGGGGSPAIVDGVVYSVGGGKVYAYSTDDNLPVAAFSASPTSGEAPLKVTFTDSSADATSWSWDFNNDGVADSTEQNPSYTYTSNGEYSVKLTVTNTYGSNVATKSEYITVSDGGSGGDTPIPVAPVPVSADTVVFQNDLHHTGVTSQAGPVENPGLSWSAYTGYMNSDPLVVDDLVISVCSGNISVLDRATGEHIWNVVTGTGGGMGGAGGNFAPACYGNGTIFYPESSDGAVSAYDIRDGSLLWKVTKLGGSYSQADTPVIYEDHRIYFGTWNGNPSGYYCYYDNGTQCWSYEGDGYYWAGAAIIGDYLVFGGESMNLTSLNKNTGEVVQTINVPETFPVTGSESQIRSSVSYDESSKRCYFTTISGYACGIGFDESTGTFVTSDKAVSGYLGSSTSTPAVYKGRLYVGVGRMYDKSETYFYCLNATDMSEIWKYTANGIIQSSPTVSTYYEDSTGDLYIYFTTDIADGTAYCLRDSAENTDASLVWQWTPPEGMRQYVLAGAVIRDGYLYFGNNDEGEAGYTFALKGTEDIPGSVVAGFTAAPLSGTAPLEVSFTDASTGAESWSWDFENDGTVDSTKQNPSYTYTSVGTYSVNLTVTGSDESDSLVRTNYVNVRGNITPVEGGDWLSFQKDNYNNGVTSERAPVSYPDSDMSWDSHAGYVNTAPIVFGDTVAISGGGLNGYNTTGGETLWSGTGGGLATPAYGNGTVFVPTMSPNIYAEDATTGKTIWSVAAGSDSKSQLNTPVTYDDHRIYFGEWIPTKDSSKYYCYYDNGTECWNRTTTSGGGYYWAGAAIVDDYLLYGDDGGHVCSVNKYTGETIQEIALSDVYGFGSGEIRSSIVYVEDYNRIYFTAKGGKCFAIGFNRESGTFDTSDAVYGTVGYSTSTPAIYNGRVYVGRGQLASYGGSRLFCLNATDLSQIWYYQANGPVQSSAGVSTYYDDGDGEVLIYFTTNCASGSLYCLRDYTGNTEAELMWKYTPPADKIQYALGSVAISDGFVYWGNNYYVGKGGRIFGLTSPDTEPSVVRYSAGATVGEPPFAVPFTSTYSGAEVSQWAWDFNDDGIVDSTEQNPTYTYTVNGTYSVDLTYTNVDGFSQSILKNDYITIGHEVPVTTISANTTAGKPALTVRFEGTATNMYDGGNWLWDFGDNTTSTEQNPVHVYDSSGLYTVTLIATNPYYLSDSVTETDYINVYRDYPVTYDLYPDSATTVKEIMDGSFQPGDTIHFHAGTYTYSGVLGGQTDLNVDDITWKGDGPDLVTLDFEDGGFANDYYLDIDGNGVTLEGFTLVNTEYGFYAEGSDLVVSNCSASNIKYPFRSKGSDAAITNCDFEGATYYGYITGANTTFADNNLDSSTSSSRYLVRVYAPDCKLLNNTLINRGGGGIKANNKLDNLLFVNNNLSVECSAFYFPKVTGVNTFYSNNFAGYGSFMESDTWNTAAPELTYWNTPESRTYTYDGKEYTGNLGNHYYDYSGTDTNGDGIGDTPFNITWTYSGTVYDFGADNAPLVSPYESYTTEGGGGSGGTEPVAAFSANATSGIAPLTVGFTDASTDATSWSWDFENDGVVDSTERNPTYTYNDTGKYSVKLTVTGPGGSDFLLKENYITTRGNITPVEGGDWLSFQKDNYNNGVTSERGPIVFSEEMSWDNYSGYVNTAPIVVGEDVIICGSGLFSYNKTEGDQIWQGSGSGLGNVAYGNGTIFVPRMNGYLDAIDSSTGETAWSAMVGSSTKDQLNTPVTYEDHRIYFGDWNDKKYYCYTDTGTEIWNRSSTSGGGYYWAGSAIVDDYLLYGDDGGHICSVNKYTGETIQDIAISDIYGFGSGEIRSSIVYVEEYGRIYFTGKGGKCFSIGFNRESGTFDTSDALYGTIGYSTSTPVIYNGRVYVGGGGVGTSGGMICLDATDFSVIWSYQPNGPVQSSPAVSAYYDDGDGEVLIYFNTNCAAGSVYCLRDYTGNTEAELMWKYTPPADKVQYVLGGVAISDGFAYWGNNYYNGKGGRIFAMTGPDIEPSIADFSANPVAGEPPLAVSFTDTSTGAETSAWAWDFENDGIVDSTEQNPTYTYSINGSYSVNLTVTNTYGFSCTKIKDDYITIGHEVPEPDFTSDVTSGDFPLTVRFTGEAEYMYDSGTWQWNFGDGTTSSGENVSHTYESAGKYSVTLTATNKYSLRSEVVKSDYIYVYRDYPVTYDVYPDSNTTVKEIMEGDIQPGDTIYFHEGTYTPEGVIGTTDLNSDGIIWKGESRDLVTLDFGSSYLTISGKGVTLESLNISSTEYGFYATGSECVVKDCIVVDPKYGFRIRTTATNSTVRDSVFERTTSRSYVEGANSLIINNTINGATSSNSQALRVYAGGCSILNNTITNTGGYALRMNDDAADTLIAYNNITASTAAFYFYRVTGVNTIYGNNFVDTGAIAYSGSAPPAVTYWNSTEHVSYHYDGIVYTGFMGNYYSDYTGADTTGDGIGSTPYEINNGFGTDYAPLIEPVESYLGEGGSGGTEPVAAFSANVTSGIAPLTVGFTDSSVNATAWAWDFENDGTVDSTKENPVHTYADAGTYSVELTVTGPEGSDSLVKSDYITVSEPGPASNWDQFQRNSDHNAVTESPAPDKNPGILWKAFTYTTDASCGGCGIDVPPVIHDGVVYTFAANGSVWAFSQNTGDLIWHRETSAGSLQSSTPAYGNGKLFVATTDGSLWCFDATDGTALWNKQVTDSNFECPVTYYDHKVYIGDGLGGGIQTKYYYCYGEDGTFLWKHANDNSAGFIWNGAAGVGGNIVYTTHEGVLTSLNATTGDLVDAKSLVSDLSFSQADAGCFRASVAYNGGYVYATSESGQSTGYCFKVKINADGTFSDEGWSHSIGFSTSTPVIVDGRVYVGHGEHGETGALICLDDASGAELWHIPVDAGVKSSPAVSTAGEKHLIYFTGAESDGELYCADGDGSLLWAFNPPSDTAYVLQGAAISNGYAYFGTDSGYLYCIEGMDSPAVPTASFTASPTNGPAPLNVSFTDTSAGYGITTWLWDFGDGSTSGESSPHHVFEEGTWTVTLTVTNSGGSDTCTRAGYIISSNGTGAAPVADFTHYTYGTVSPVSVKFNDTSANNPASWLWDFGDETTSTMQNPTHQYVNAGTYTVTLTATNEYGADSVTKSGIVTVDSWTTPGWATDDSWTQFHKDETHSGFSEGSAPSTSDLLWVSEDISAEASSSVVIAEGRVFVNTGETIVSLDQKTGRYLGEHGPGNSAQGSWSTPAYNNGYVWCGIEDYPEGSFLSTVDGGSLAVDGKVFTSNWDGEQYFAFDEETGEQLWSFNVTGKAQSNPVYRDGRLFVNSWDYGSPGNDGYVYCLEADTGELVWEKNNIVYNPCGSPTINGDNLYLTTYNFYGDGELYALDTATGDVVWVNSSVMRTDATPAYAYGNLYICGGCDGFCELAAYCFNATTGEPVWQTGYEDRIGSWTCSPAVADGKVFVGTSKGYSGSSGLTCLDAYTGEIIWQDEGGGGSPAIVDGTVFSVGVDGKVYAYNSVEGTPVADFTASPRTGDEPLTVQFEDRSSGRPSSWSWDFDNDGVVDSTEENPGFTYNTSGKYSVSLTVSNAFGTDSELKADYIDVRENVVLPEADFNASVTNGKVPLTVEFGDLSSAGCDNWSWKFGDGGVSDEQNPVHVYTVPGIYSVNLTVSDINGTASELKVEYINVTLPAIPVAGFSSNVNVGVAPLEVEFTDESTNSPDTWLWDFGDGETSEEQNPVHEYRSVGVYTVTLTAANDEGNATKSEPGFIEVPDTEPLPGYNDIYVGAANDDGISYNIFGNQTYYMGAGAAGAGMGSVGISENPSGSGEVLATTETSGEFYIINTGDRSYYDDVVLMLAVDGTIPEDFEVDILASGYEWTSSGEMDVGPSFENLTYKAKSLDETFTKADLGYGPQNWKPAAGEDDCPVFCDEEMSDIRNGFRMMFIDTHAGIPGCENATDLGAVKVSYTFRNLTGSAAFNVYGWCMNTSAGSGLMWTNSPSGDKASGYSVMPEDEQPFIPEFTAEPVNGIVPLEVAFSDATGEGASAWSWNFGDGGISEEQNPVHKYDMPGTYSVNLTAADESGANSTLKVNYVHVSYVAVPTANFTADVTSGKAPLAVTFTDESEGNVTGWAWDFNNDGAVDSTEQNPEWSYSSKGTYSVKLTVTNSVGGTDSMLKENYISVSGKTPAPSTGGGSSDSGGDSDSGKTSTVTKPKEEGDVPVSEEGKVLANEDIPSEDGYAAVEIPKGTIALDKEGEPVESVGIEKIDADSVPDTSAGSDDSGADFEYMGRAYECSPSGATFSPGIEIVFYLSSYEEYQEFDGKTPAIRYYNSETEEWEDIETTFDEETMTVRATITHFSVYALFAKTDSGTPAVTEEPTTSATAAGTTTVPSSTSGGAVTSQPTSGSGDEPASFPVAAVAAIVIVILAVCGVALYVSKNKKGGEE